MSISISGLEPGAGKPWCRADGGVDARQAISWVASLGRGSIQLDATMPGIRPRELDRSGRRELAAILRRSGLTLSGIDLFVPPEHFASAANVERAMQAATNAAELMGELAGLMPAPLESQRTVSMTLPKDVPSEVVSSLGHVAQRQGVRFADHRVGAAGNELVGVGIDPAAVLLAGQDPATLASRLGGARTSIATDASADILLSARLSDANDVGRVPIGSGRLDRLAYFVALHTSGYDRPVIVDLRGVKDQVRSARSAIGPTR